jgi:hypothetical protein
MAADPQETADLQDREEYAISVDDHVIDGADPLVFFVEDGLTLEIVGPQPLRDRHDIYDDHFGSHDRRSKFDGTAESQGDRERAMTLARRPTNRETIGVWIRIRDRTLRSFNLIFAALHDIASGCLLICRAGSASHLSTRTMLDIDCFSRGCLDPRQSFAVHSSRIAVRPLMPINACGCDDR